MPSYKNDFFFILFLHIISAQEMLFISECCCFANRIDLLSTVLAIPEWYRHEMLHSHTVHEPVISPLFPYRPRPLLLLDRTTAFHFSSTFLRFFFSLVGKPFSRVDSYSYMDPYIRLSTFRRVLFAGIPAYLPWTKRVSAPKLFRRPTLPHPVWPLGLSPCIHAIPQDSLLAIRSHPKPPFWNEIAIRFFF